MVLCGVVVEKRSVDLSHKGICQVSVETTPAVLLPGRNSTRQTFLELLQPVSSAYSTTLEPGKSYKFLFEFIVLERLLPHSCINTTCQAYVGTYLPCHFMKRRLRCLKKPPYTATIIVPVTLPENKAFIPTFHS